MNKLPAEIKKKLRKEAEQWDEAIYHESPEKTERLLREAERFKASRPARQPVSLRMDPFDLSMIKRLARQRGLPHTQLMAMWLHERVEKEKKESASG